MSKPFTQLALIRCLQSGGRENGQVDSAASGVVPVVCVFLGSGERDFPGSSRAVSGRWGWCGFGGGSVARWAMEAGTEAKSTCI